MITKLKLFENDSFNSELPFTLSKSKLHLYINKEVIEYLLTTSNYSKIDEKCINVISKNYEKYLENEKINKTNNYNICYKFKFNNNKYIIDIVIKSVKSNNKLKYYISGFSGTFEMHNVGMIRATKEINFEIINMFFKNHIPNKKDNINIYELINSEDLSYYKKMIDENAENIKKLNINISRKKFNL